MGYFFKQYTDQINEVPKAYLEPVISLGKQATAKGNYFHRKLSLKKTESVLNITLGMFKLNKFRNFQSRHRRCSIKKFHYIYKKTPVLESLFNKVVVLQDRKALFNITYYDSRKNLKKIFCVTSIMQLIKLNNCSI